MLGPLSGSVIDPEDRGPHYDLRMTADQRLLLVHAHPDDESIGQGATMAKYVAEGRGVTLVTCTAGEMGEILSPSSSTSPPTRRTAWACTARARWPRP